MTKILGISAYYHDSAAALVVDGEIEAAAQQERFSRKKHDGRFPAEAIRYCLSEDSEVLRSLDYIAFYDKPMLKFERLLETYLAYAPRGLRSFLTAMPVWLKEKLFLKTVLKKELAALGNCTIEQLPPLLFTEHHQSHAAAAFFPSPFQEAAVLCLDGVGEWATSSVWHGQGPDLTAQWEIQFPHSLGLLYSAFTTYAGFKVNSGEYKLMGLAPYGEPKYADIIRNELMDIKPDGTFRLNMDYFSYPTALTMTGDRFAQLFNGPPREPESPLTQREMDLAASVQLITEDVVMGLAKTVHGETQLPNLCLSGGVALNCVANGKLIREGPFDQVWVQPASGDAGGAIGAALATWHQYLGNQRNASSDLDTMKGTLLGPCPSEDEITTSLDQAGAVYQQLVEADLYRKTADALDSGGVVGWFQGRMEFGPRALGARSILADPRRADVQSVMNLKIKHRESFRPFAPSILAEHRQDYFDLSTPSPYMLIVADVLPQRRIPVPDDKARGLDLINAIRSDIPAVTHVDFSARVQTVDETSNPKYLALLQAWHQLTGCPLLVNTSFNVRGEPMVCTPDDAYRCFMRTGMDYLVIGNCILAKAEQPEWQESQDWQQEFELD